MKITTHFVYPPIPLRNFDWMACRGDYEPGCRVGYGDTEQAAINDLLDQEYDDEPLPYGGAASRLDKAGQAE